MDPVYDHEWGSLDDRFTYAVLQVRNNETGNIQLYDAVTSDLFEGALEPGVVWCAASDPVMVTAPLVVDFYE